MARMKTKINHYIRLHALAIHVLYLMTRHRVIATLSPDRVMRIVKYIVLLQQIENPYIHTKITSDIHF